MEWLTSETRSAIFIESRKNCRLVFGMRFLLAVLLLILTFHVQARDFGGDNPKRDSLLRYRNTVDTNYIRKYPDRFIVTLSQSLRTYDIRFRQTMTEDSLGWGSPIMMSNLKWSSGVALDFDKLSLTVGLSSQPYTNEELRLKGKTKYTALGLSFVLYRFRFEASYRKYQGFYDTRTPIYNSVQDSSWTYYQDPDFMARSVRVKALFIFNKRKFSYNAAYFNTQRQLKSAGSWLMVGNIYDNLFSTKTSLIPDSSRYFFQQYGLMNHAHLQGISIGPGYSYNLVIWKTLFVNLTLTSGFDIQHRQIKTYDYSYAADYWKIGAAGDFRAAIGLNGKRMFLSLTYRQDYNSYVMQGMTIQSRYHAIDLNFGYRFKMRRGRLYTKLNQNKWYQLI